MDSHLEPSMDRSIPHDKRWPLLKDIIVELFIGQGMSLPTIADRMRAEYGFDAQQPHYRYRLRSWGIHKRLTAAEKNKIIDGIAKRRRAGASTSNIVLHKGGIRKDMTERNKAQLRRYINEQNKRGPASLPAVSPGFIMSWNFPYAAFINSQRRPFDHRSPSASDTATPPFFTIPSPAAAASPPGPINAPSPTTQLLRERATLNQVGLFLQGRPGDLLKNLHPEEQRSASTWFHDLFLFSFMSAKYWGRGPQRWDYELIAARSLGSQLHSLPNHIHSLPASPGDDIAPQADPEALAPPNMLCRGTRYWDISYTALLDPPIQASGEQDIEDETTWMPWATRPDKDLPEVIREGISSSSFTQAVTALPVSSPVVTEVLGRSEDELEAEAIAFTIITGNSSHLYDLIGRCPPPLALGQLYPFHLAAAHLHGASSCCLILDTLMESACEEVSARTHYLNNQGHTILDSLMITILRAHTSIEPAVVCETFGKAGRFPGEGVDPCGRWDLDSPCIRRLFSSGYASLPVSWKHPFCHPSVQAVCHSITMIVSRPWSPKINTPSGIFIRNCGSCGSRLTPTPLHTLLVVAYCLASQGTQGETLFGAIAVLCCMLVHDANPLDAVDISPSLLFPNVGTPTTDECQHSVMTPSAFARGLAGSVGTSWSRQAQLGWDVFMRTLDLAVTARSDSQSARAALAINCIHTFMASEHLRLSNHYCQSPSLGRLWAAVQAEFVTYRRVEDGDGWVSADFDLQLLQTSLMNGSSVAGLPLIANELIRNHTTCGWYVKNSRYDEEGIWEIWQTPLPMDVSHLYFKQEWTWATATRIRMPWESQFVHRYISQEAQDEDEPEEEVQEDDDDREDEIEDGVEGMDQGR